VNRLVLAVSAVIVLAACSGQPTAPPASTPPASTPSAPTASASSTPAATPTQQPITYAGVFTRTATLTTARSGHTATLLPNGLVLIVGGQGSDASALASAELYDPATGRLQPTGSLHEARTMHSATLLLNGKVLIAGGGKTVEVPNPFGASLPPALSCCDPVVSAELYDPATGTFNPAGTMHVSRFPGMTGTLLADGRVLFAGGHDGGSERSAIASAELYDPSNGTYTATGSMATARYGHTATLLNDSEVLVAGGQGPNGGNLVSAELYDPASGSFHPTGALHGADAFHTATLLANGWVLIVGDADSDNLSHGELYVPDPSGNGAAAAFSDAGTTAGRFGATATLLADGRVLIVGGRLGGNVATAVLFDPATKTFASTGSLAVPRFGQTATLLPDGRVLIVGGLDDGDYPIDAVELFR
jgi:hypothetical protein